MSDLTNMTLEGALAGLKAKEFSSLEITEAHIKACEDASDANDDGELDLTDALDLLEYLFLGGLAPAAPHPEPGEDPTADSLGCEYGL